MDSRLIQAQPLPMLDVVDFPHPPAEERHANPYFPKYTTVRMIISGRSNCGKTVLDYNVMIKHDLCEADRMIFMTTTIGQQFYTQLQELVETTPELKSQIEIYDHLLHIDELKLDKNIKNAISIDDFIERAEDPILMPYFTRSRPLNADVMFLTQAFYPVPPTYRRNSNLIALFRGSCDARDTRNKVWQDHCTDIPFELFDSWYRRYVLRKSTPSENNEWQNGSEHDFLLIDQETTDLRLKYRHGLSEYLPVPIDENEYIQ